jgi:hypothetical protein
MSHAEPRMVLDIEGERFSFTYGFEYYWYANGTQVKAWVRRQDSYMSRFGDTYMSRFGDTPWEALDAALEAWVEWFYDGPTPTRLIPRDTGSGE